MSQIAALEQALSVLGVTEGYRALILILFSMVLMIATTVSILEKLGVLNLISKLIVRPSPVEHELKALEGLMTLKKEKPKDIKDNPYFDCSFQLKEIALLNNYFKSDLKYLKPLKYIFTRQDNKRAYRLYSSIKEQLFLDPSNDGYVLKPWVNKWVIYLPMGLWFFIYFGTAAYFIYQFIHSGGLKESFFYVVGLYILIAILALAVGWLTVWLLWPWQAMKFASLEKRP